MASLLIISPMITCIYIKIGKAQFIFLKASYTQEVVISCLIYYNYIMFTEKPVYSGHNWDFKILSIIDRCP